MKSAEEIYNAVKENYTHDGFYDRKLVALEAMKEYAEQVALQALKDASENAKVFKQGRIIDEIGKSFDVLERGIGKGHVIKRTVFVYKKSILETEIKA